MKYRLAYLSSGLALCALGLLIWGRADRTDPGVSPPATLSRADFEEGLELDEVLLQPREASGSRLDEADLTVIVNPETAAYTWAASRYDLWKMYDPDMVSRHTPTFENFRAALLTDIRFESTTREELLQIWKLPKVRESYLKLKTVFLAHMWLSDYEGELPLSTAMPASVREVLVATHHPDFWDDLAEYEESIGDPERGEAHPSGKMDLWNHTEGASNEFIGVILDTLLPRSGSLSPEQEKK